MTKDEAIKVLVQVAHLAQKGGLLNLKDAPLVAKAVAVAEAPDTPVEEKKKK